MPSTHVTSDNGLTLKGLGGEWLSDGQGYEFGEPVVLHAESHQPTRHPTIGPAPEGWYGVEPYDGQGY